MTNLNLSNDITFSNYIESFWKNLIYLLVSLPLGILYFTVTITGICLGVGTSIIYIGVPILAGTLILARKFVAFDKLLACKILNLPLPEAHNSFLEANTAEGLIKKLLYIIRSPQNWSSVLYCILKLPLGIMYFTVATCLSTLSLGLLICPLFYGLTVLLGWDLFMFNSDVFSLLGIYIPQGAQALLCFLLGAGISYVTLKVFYSLAHNSSKAVLKMF